MLGLHVWFRLSGEMCMHAYRLKPQNVSCFNQPTGLTSSVQVVPVGTVDGRVSWARRLLHERGGLLFNNPDKTVMQAIGLPPPLRSG